MKMLRAQLRNHTKVLVVNRHHVNYDLGQMQVFLFSLVASPHQAAFAKPKTPIEEHTKFLHCFFYQLNIF